MNSFEQEYYEDESLWGEGMLQDEGNKERVRITSELIPGDVKSLLDVGCGNGIFLNYLLDNKKDAISLMGLDRSKTALQFVKTNKVQGDIKKIEIADNSFDCVTALEVIEHLPITDFSAALAEVARVSKKYVIISVPYAEILEDNSIKCPECKTIFNRDFHMRSFDENKFKSVLVDFGYRNINVKKAGKVEIFVGQRVYRRFFPRKTALEWNSSICPMCGYKEQVSYPLVNTIEPGTSSKSPLSVFASIPKMFWPKTYYYYWIIGLFEK